MGRSGSSGKRQRAMRVFLGPTEIAGYYAGLEAGLRELGVDVLHVDLDAHPFQYGRSARLPLVPRLARWVRISGRDPQAPEAVSPGWKVLRLLTRVLLLLWAIPRFDVFVFGFGLSIVGLRDLPLLRILGKRIVFIFHGSDARPPYIDGARVAPGRAPPVSGQLALTRRMKANFRRIERHADAVIAQPAFSHLFERPVVDWFVVGMPWRDLPPIASPARPAGAPIRILHSPSNPVVKGSARIRAAVEELRAAGLSLELIELRGVPNAVVRQEIAACDFVVDQIYSDAPMVGFATEAASAGKPAVVGGYAWPENHRILRVDQMPPVEECEPEQIATAIRHLALDPEHRATLGRRAQEYVAAWTARKAAERVLLVIEGRTPPGWLFDPHELRYVEGCGLARDDARANVAAIIEAGGKAALCVADKPELEQLFVEFAAGGTKRPEPALPADPVE